MPGSYLLPPRASSSTGYGAYFGTPGGGVAPPTVPQGVEPQTQQAAPAGYSDYLTEQPISQNMPGFMMGNPGGFGLHGPLLNLGGGGAGSLPFSATQQAVMTAYLQQMMNNPYMPQARQVANAIRQVTGGNNMQQYGTGDQTYGYRQPLGGTYGFPGG